MGAIAHSQSNYKNTPLPHDTTLPNGSFVKYALQNDTSYVVTLGTGQFQRELPARVITSGSDYPILEKANDYALILEAGCGSPCWNAIVLPLDSNLGATTFEYPLAYDMDNNLVACAVYKQDSIVAVRNFLTGKTMAIIDQGSKAVSFLGYRIDTVSLSNKVFYMRWYTEDVFDTADSLRKAAEVRIPLDL